MVKKVTKNNTKAEILSAYLEIEDSYGLLEKEVSELQKKLEKASSGNGSNKNKTLKNDSIKVDNEEKSFSSDEHNKPSASGGNNDNYNIDKILNSLEHLQIGFGGAASKLSEKLIAEASTLEELRNSVFKVKNQLKELHNLEEIEDDTLDHLLESYKENAKSYENEFNNRQEALEQKYQSLQEDWRKEQDKYNQEKKERDETYRKAQKRDTEEYEYELKLNRDLDEDEYTQRKKNLYQELKDQKETQEREWELREEEISKREEEYKTAQEKVEKHEQDKGKRKNDGREEGKRIGNSQAKIELDMLTKDIEGERQNYLLRIDTLDQTIQNHNDSIKDLTAQLDATLKQVQDLAVKAIEGSSNRNAYDAIKEVTNELAKNQHKGK